MDFLQSRVYFTKSKNALSDLTRKIVCKHECHKEFQKAPVRLCTKPPITVWKKNVNSQHPSYALLRFHERFFQAKRDNIKCFLTSDLDLLFKNPRGLEDYRAAGDCITTGTSEEMQRTLPRILSFKNTQQGGSKYTPGLDGG